MNDMNGSFFFNAYKNHCGGDADGRLCMPLPTAFGLLSLTMAIARELTDPRSCIGYGMRGCCLLLLRGHGGVVLGGGGGMERAKFGMAKGCAKLCHGILIRSHFLGCIFIALSMPTPIVLAQFALQLVHPEAPNK